MNNEIPTPINGIAGMTERFPDTATNSFLPGTESPLSLAGDALDLSKIETGTLNFEKVDFDLRSTVETVAKQLDEDARVKNIELALGFQPEVPAKVCGDPRLLRKVLTNLIGNAVKFTERGSIIVRVSKRFEDPKRVMLRFEVEYSGIGGAGIELAISKQLVGLMGGNISLQCSPGHSSTLILTASFLKHSEQGDFSLPKQVDLKNVRMLIVDDAPEERKLLTQHAAGWGMLAEVAENATEALIKLRRAVADGMPFEVAILDQNMPDMVGTDLAKIIKADKTIADVELILIPSNGRRGDGRVAREIGIRAYFSKPLSESQLFDCLTTVLSNKSEAAKAAAGLITRHSLNEIRSATNRLVLLVEDNAINQTVTLSQLSKSGYRIDIAANGQEALAAFSRKQYDAVLMDCQMPVMDGYQATTEIRKRERGGRRTPIIAMTANAMTGDREKCLSAGMDEYITKPVRRETLEAILERALSDELQASADIFQEAAIETAAIDSPVDFECLMDAASNNPEKAKRLTELFIKFTSERLGDLEDAIGRGDATDVYSIAHKSLGSSRTLGMNAIVPALRELEVRGRAGELHGLGEHLETAKSEFAKIKTILKEHFDAGPTAPSEVNSYV